MYHIFNMSQTIVSITSQGQLTIPKAIRDAFGITGAVKAVLKMEGDHLVVKPQKSFWDLAGTLNTGITLTDQELRDARNAFSQEWGEKD